MKKITTAKRQAVVGAEELQGVRGGTLVVVQRRKPDPQPQPWAVGLPEPILW
jgi:hypothetical protein